MTLLQQQTRKLKGLMTNYILPAIGNMRVTDIDLNDIKAIVINNFGYDPLLIYGFHQGNIAIQHQHLVVVG